LEAIFKKTEKDIKESESIIKELHNELEKAKDEEAKHIQVIYE